MEGGGTILAGQSPGKISGTQARLPSARIASDLHRQVREVRAGEKPREVRAGESNKCTATRAKCVDEAGLKGRGVALVSR
jgi:uncharacterized low-complexity protein